MKKPTKATPPRIRKTPTIVPQPRHPTGQYRSPNGVYKAQNQPYMATSTDGQ